MKIRYSETVSWVSLGKFAFVFEEVSDIMFRFEGILKDLWLAIDKKNELDEIIEFLWSKYDVEKSVLHGDIVKAIMSLEASGLLIKEE